MVQSFWKTIWQFLKKLNILLSYDPPVTLLGTYPRERKRVYMKNLYMIFHSSFICSNQKLLLEDTEGKGKLGRSKRVALTYIHYQM